jgi:hypothetical protein
MKVAGEAKEAIDILLIALPLLKRKAGMGL